MKDQTQNAIWPLPKFYFKVTWGTSPSAASFQEVSGLDTVQDNVEYRQEGDSKFAPIKMPGINTFNNVTLKKGVFVKDNSFWKWYDSIKMNTIKRETVKIELLDENGNTTRTWALLNAWPTKISGTDLKSDGNEVAIETLELAHEGIKINNG